MEVEGVPDWEEKRVPDVVMLAVRLTAGGRGELLLGGVSALNGEKMSSTSMKFAVLLKM